FGRRRFSVGMGTTDVGGIDMDLGASGEPRGPIEEAFARLGVPISGSLLTGMRSGAVSRAHTTYRLGCVDRLRANDPSLKTDHCLRVLAVAVEQRRRSNEPPRGYACHGLTRRMSAALGCSHPELGYVV